MDPWPVPEEEEVGDRGAGVTATVGAGGAGGVGGMGGVGGVGGMPPTDCTNPAILQQLTQDVKDKLYVAQLCDPTADELKCDMFVEGMCCEEVVDPGTMDLNVPNINAYLEALQKWKDAGCKCPQDPPECPPFDMEFGFCDGTGFPAPNEGICVKIFL